MNSFEECYLFLPSLASLRLGARNIRSRESFIAGKFAQAAQGGKGDILNFKVSAGHDKPSLNIFRF
jgi:hypothetical protein